MEKFRQQLNNQSLDLNSDIESLLHKLFLEQKVYQTFKERIPKIIKEEIQNIHDEEEEHLHL